MIEHYTKLFSSIVTSTIWAEPSATRVVWITMLAIADKNGYVAGSIPGLAHVARVSREECESALVSLSNPDEDSRTKTEEGRRIEVCDGGWMIVNYAAYRERLSELDKREYFRLAKRREREQKRSGVSKMSLTVQDKSKSPLLISLSLPFGSEAFKEAWSVFERHRDEIRKPLRPTSAKMALKHLGSIGEARAIAMIEHTVAMGWQGLKEPNYKPGEKPPEPKRPQAEIDAEQDRLARNFK